MTVLSGSITPQMGGSIRVPIDTVSATLHYLNRTPSKALELTLTF